MPHKNDRAAAALAVAALLLLAPAAVAHAPSVATDQVTSPDAPMVLDDPTLSRAIGATLASEGEVDWYRMDLRAGDPLVVGMTAPDAAGAVAATFTLLGPGLPDAGTGSPRAQALADAVGTDGALEFEPAADPPLEVHAGLGFFDYGTIRLEAPETGAYLIAVESVEPEATGKYVLAPGLREEFGLDAVGGMVDLIGFFNEPWPPSDSGSEQAG